MQRRTKKVDGNNNKAQYTAKLKECVKEELFLHIGK